MVASPRGLDRPSGAIRDFPPLLALRLCLRAAPRSTMAALALGVFLGAVPVALYVAVALFAGEVARDPSGVALELWVPVVAGLFFLLQGSSQLLHQVNAAVGREVDAWVQQGVMRAALAPPTIAHMETAEFREAADLARNWESSPHPPSDAAYSLIEIVKAAVVALGSVVLIAAFSWWVPILLATGYVLMTVWGTRVRRTSAKVKRSEAGLRRAQYLRDLAFDPASGREARVFGLADWFRERADGEWRQAMSDIWADRAGTRWTALLTIVALIGSHVFVLGLIMSAALDGRVDVTQAALYLQGAGGLVNLWLPWHVVALREATRPFPALERLTSGPDTRGPTPSREPVLAPSAPSRDIAFEDVTFRYPGREMLVFDGLDLRIEAGRSLAIVGANGAGKTTLVKLLCGLLDPDAGHVSVDGADVRAARTAWQRRVAVIFQDFVRYPISAHDNVTVGRDAPTPDAAERALSRALAADLVAELPAGLDTVLAREFDGVDLSGGQWQRIALARALYAVERGATVRVLDEPTAQLDVRAEAALFDRFLDLTAGLTTVLISHRFSSVRHADRIVVLEHGRVVEDGSHAELVTAGGRYAEMFAQQARHFEAADG